MESENMNTFCGSQMTILCAAHLTQNVGTLEICARTELQSIRTFASTCRLSLLLWRYRLAESLTARDGVVWQPRESVPQD
jgi:hypothetical protein